MYLSKKALFRIKQAAFCDIAILMFVYVFAVLSVFILLNPVGYALNAYPVLQISQSTL